MCKKSLQKSLVDKMKQANEDVAVKVKEFRIFDSYFNRNDCDFNPRQRRGDRKNIEYYIERIHEQVRIFFVEKFINNQSVI